MSKREFTFDKFMNRIAGEKNRTLPHPDRPEEGGGGSLPIPDQQQARRNMDRLYRERWQNRMRWERK